LENSNKNRTLENNMELKFSPRVKDVISYSKEEAMRLGHEYIGVEHFLLGIIREGEGLAAQIMKQSADLQHIRKELEKSLKPNSSSNQSISPIFHW
jgi:ATP-dependent Clp protease ATP-binding subunit ClpC